MDILAKIWVLLTFCETGHANGLNPKISVQGYNATISFHANKTDGKQLLEINFFSYTSNRHFTNVLFYMTEKGQTANISINVNYTSRIDKVVMDKDHFRFLLLNISFNDSGNYTVNENSNVKGITNVLVARRIYAVQIWKPCTLSFIFYEKNTSSINVYNPTSKLSQPVVIYNATNDSCILLDVVSLEKKNIQNCVLRKGEFSFIIPEIGWLHKGSYFAWDDKGRLLDSIVLNIQENTMTGYLMTPSSLDIGKEMDTLPIISALWITILSACLVVFAVWKLRIRRARMSAMHNIIYRNGIQNIVCRSGDALIPEETRIVSTKNNSNELSKLKRNKIQTKVKLNDQNMCVRGLGCGQSSSNTRCQLQIDSSLSSAETIQSDSVHGYDYVHECDELATDCQSKQPYIRSKLLGANSIGSTSQSSFEYNYVVQRRFMTLRPPAPDPVVKKNNKQQNIVADSFYSIKKVNKRSLPKDYPSNSFAKTNNKLFMESHRTRSSNELSLNLTNVVSCPRFVQLEKDFAKKAVEWPQKSRKIKCLNSKVNKCMPEPSQFRDSKTRSASQCLSDDYPRDDYDQPYAMETRHRRSWSNDALCESRMFKTKASQSRRFSASFCMDEDYYDCLNSSCNT